MKDTNVSYVTRHSASENRCKLYPPESSPKPIDHHLTLKEDPKVKSDHIKRFLAHDFQLVGVISTFNFGYPHLTLKEGPKLKSDHIKRLLAHDFP